MLYLIPLGIFIEYYSISYFVSLTLLLFWSSYNKGAIVIRMIHSKIGEETFKIGIRNYLNKHKFGNVTPTDLIEALTEASGITDLSEMMKSWLYVKGFPLVSIKEIKGKEIDG